jgi:meso-butanediol dehydrogenase / (S,S)-butanediol dehydrogenase / diacetyl reductase
MGDGIMGRLQDRVALVTGAGSGIGEAIALRFGAEGAVILATDRHPATAERTAARIRGAGGRAEAHALDIAEDGAAAALVTAVAPRLGTIEVLVNNAGAGSDLGPLEVDLATWERMLRINLTGHFLCIQAVLPGMLAQGRGSIVSISSVNGLTGLGEEGYSAAKAGLVNLAQNIAVRFGGQGVRSNVIAPGTIRTPIWDRRLAERPDAFDQLRGWYPLARIGEPADVAAAALFLASDESAWVTGAVLPVDGGLTAGLGRMIADLSG